MASTRLTKAQLIARIDQLERELDAEFVRNRPSRQWPIGVSPRQAAAEASTFPKRFNTKRFTDRNNVTWEKHAVPGSRVKTLVRVSH